MNLSRLAYKTARKYVNMEERLGELPFTLTEFAYKVMEAVDHGQCPYCLRKLTIRNFSPDHLISVKHGGSSELDNIEIVCWPCNKEKSWGNFDWYISTKPWQRRKRLGMRELMRKYPMKNRA
jgi:hypothetical protein